MSGSKEGTLVVLAFVAKQDGLFKASDVFAETGLERPLVYYHLNRLVEKGLIEKAGSSYCVLDRDRLIEAIAYGNTRKKFTEASDTIIFKNSKELNRTINSALRAKAMVLPGSRELKDEINNSIDKTIDALKAAKRLLNSRQIKPQKAKKNFEVEDYFLRLKVFGVEVDKDFVKLALENEFVSFKHNLQDMKEDEDIEEVEEVETYLEENPAG